MAKTIDTHAHIIPESLIFSRFLQTEERMEDGKRAFYLWGKRICPVHPGLTNVDAHLERMEREKIDMEALSLSPYVMGYEKPADFCAEWARAFNEELARICRLYPSRFVGLGTLPMQDVEASVRELEYCRRELGLAGVQLCSHVNGEDLDTEKFAPLFQRANELGCAILIHPFNVPPPPRMKVYYTLNLVGNPVETTLTVARMLLSGFFEKYPRVKVCFAHGGGAFPYIYSRIRNGFRVRPEPHAGGLTSVDLPDNLFFDTIVYEQRTYEFLRDMCGLEHVCLGSDYPFDMQLPDAAPTVRAWAGSEAEARAVLQDNVARWLDV